MKSPKQTTIIWHVGFWLSGLLLVAVLSSILLILIYRGGSSLSLEFLTSIPKGAILGKEGGIFPAIAGTLSLTILSSLFASLPALLVAIYIVEYGKDGLLARVVTTIVQIMIGIPSILIGLFGYALFVVFFNMGISLAAGALTLAVMIFPTLVVFMRNALQSVSDEYRLVGISLGTSRRYLIQRVILPQALPHICSSLLLAMGYAAGATAPIMVTAAVIMTRSPVTLHHPVMALPFHLYILFSQQISIDRAYGTALVLVMLLLSLNAISLYVQKHYEKKVHPHG